MYPRGGGGGPTTCPIHSPQPSAGRLEWQAETAEHGEHAKSGSDQAAYKNSQILLIPGRPLLLRVGVDDRVDTGTLPCLSLCQSQTLGTDATVAYPIAADQSGLRAELRTSTQNTPIEASRRARKSERRRLEERE